MLRLSKHIAHLFLLSLLFVGSAIAAQPLWQVLPETINKSVSDPREYKAIKLNNDMTVLLVSDPKATKSLAAVSLPVGSIENPNSQLGLAHYLEHMVLMGSKNTLNQVASRSFYKNTAEAIMLARHLIAPLTILKLKMGRLRLPRIDSRMHSRSRYLTP